MPLKKELEYKLTALEHQLQNIKNDTALLIEHAANDYAGCDTAKEYIARLAQIVGCDIPRRELRISVDIWLPMTLNTSDVEVDSITVNGEEYKKPYLFDVNEL